MKFNKYAMIVISIPLVIAIVAGSYFVRWFSVLVLGALLTFLLFWVEIKVVSPRKKGRRQEKRKTDVERTANLIKRARKGAVARALLEEKIVEIYALLSEDYNLTHRTLVSEPNEALRVLRSGGDFLDNLEKALKIVEADLNEDRGT